MYICCSMYVHQWVAVTQYKIIFVYNYICPHEFSPCCGASYAPGLLYVVMGDIKKKLSCTIIVIEYHIYCKYHDNQQIGSVCGIVQFSYGTYVNSVTSVTPNRINTLGPPQINSHGNLIHIYGRHTAVQNYINSLLTVKVRRS